MRLTVGQIARLARLSVLAARGRESALRRELARPPRLPDVPVREAFLQLVLFAGYPRAINALFLLGESKGLRPTGGTVATRRKRGAALCRRIYGRDFGPLLGNMRRLHPALAEGILEEGYGRVLSRPGLEPRVRELVLVPLLAATDAWRQLPGHVRGALRVGATPAGIARVVASVGDLLGERRVRRVLAYAVRSERGRWA
ncbi:MAG: carboxymuconolactone decarboxylase family protein [Planctomycetes bacterium]|nr:carboxymuconolactone decarboxylase family protein [Planctomycetota bacterium]